ncbi:uracil-xanthine permease family protein [Actinomycetota bacterium]
MAAFGWKLKGDGHTLAPGEVVAPDERLAWGKTIGLGAQHVVAMFGATFVFPLLMGLNPQLAIMLSGFATLCFLLVLKGTIPSYLGSSASFVGIAAAISRQPGADLSTLTGATLVCGLVLALVGLVIHVVGSGVIHAVLPPVVTGAVVMLIGFNLAPVVADTYWPQDQWVALAVMVFAIVCAVAFRGFIGRISIFLSLVFGYLLSWVLDKVVGPVTSVMPGTTFLRTDLTKPCPPDVDAALLCVQQPFSHNRVDFSAVADAAWFGLPQATKVVDGQTIPGVHFPTFSMAAILLVLPAVVALIAENTGHVKAVAEMTGADLDGQMGKAIAVDGLTTMASSAVGGAPTTTYAENIGVMAATRVYSTAAYFVAALFAIGFGLIPKFGALVAGVPGGVLGGICVVLYGMIGLLGAKIWRENDVDFSNPINLVPVAAGIIIGIGNTSLDLSRDFQLGGIALGTIVTIAAYHLARATAHADLKDADGAVITVGHEGTDRFDDELR